MKIGDILLGRVSKRYTHDMSATLNTTMDFGTVQPLYCTYLMKNSDVTINYKQLLRPAPMVSPTFGRVTEHTVTRFVPVSEIFPAFDALLSHRGIQGDERYIPTSVPIVSNSALVTYLLLEQSDILLYRRALDEQDGKYIVQSSSYVETNVQFIVNLLHNRVSYTNDIADSLISDSIIAHYSNVIEPFTPQSSDFSFVGTVGSSNIQYLVCFRLKQTGKNIYKILTGLGYGLDFTNKNPVSALPLFAFYKAYFDTYYNQRHLSWHDTPIYSYVQSIYNENGFDFLTNYYTLRSFLSNFTKLLYSSPTDYVSVHTLNPITYANGQVSSDYDISSLDANGNLAQTNNDSGIVPNLRSQSSVTYFQLQALKALTKYVSKDSVIGGRVLDWFKTHFGTTPSDDMFMPSKFLDEHIVNLNIDDVFTTADTYNPDTNTGSYTGSYAGKGLGFSDANEIRFSAPDFGYLIILGSVAPEIIYSDGDSPQLYGLDRYTLPNTDFDALGYELTPLACIGGFQTNVSASYDPVSNNLTGKSFGYIPRYSGWKIQKSVVNGDLKLHSTRQGLSSYYLDKMIDTRQVYLSDGYLVDSGLNHDSTIPKASVNWSYPTGIEQFGDFNRIFYNRGFPSQVGENFRPYQTYRMDDNFIFQASFEVKVTNDLKPIRESYDIPDSEENSRVSVKSE